MKRSIQSLVILSSIGLCTISIMFFAASNVSAKPTKHSAKTVKYPEEVGPAKFLSNHNAAMKQAKTSGKPVFAFFQEVPG